MGNLGKIKITAKVGGAMPNMDQTKRPAVHDLPSADAYQSYMSRGEGGDTKNIEFLSDPVAGGFFVIPQRATAQVANYVNGVASSNSLATPRVMWSVLTHGGGADISGCVGSESYLTRLIDNTEQHIVAPTTDKGSTLYEDFYVGPRWSIPRGAKVVVPKEMQNTLVSTTPTTPVIPTADDFSTSFVAQEAVCQDIWWSIQTTSLSSNPVGTPFYVDVVMQRPIASKQPTSFVLRVGKVSGTADVTTDQEIIDLVFVEGEAPKLYDRGMMITKTTETDGKTKTEIVPASITLPASVAWDGKTHRIAFIPLAGRLCISVDGNDVLYTRVDSKKADAQEESGDTEGSPALTMGTSLFFISYDQIRAIGTNSQVAISLGSVIFEKEAELHTNMPGGFDPNTQSSNLVLKGSANGLTDGSVVSLVQCPDNRNDTTILGAFAKTSDGFALSATDTWGKDASEKMHGEVNLYLADNNKGASTAKTKVGKHHVIQLISEKGAFGEQDVEAKWKLTLCPIWFRLRGVNSATVTAPTTPSQEDVSDDIMEMSENFASGDRYHTTHSIDLVLYNENGKHDSLCDKSTPIQVGYVWSGPNDDFEVDTTIFTGIVLSGSKSLIAGKETVSLHCEDYMFILEATLVINSPYYDGMDGYNIVRDLAAKANIQCTDGTGGEEGERFFVPSGYSFLEPVKRYDHKMAVKECILDVCSMGAKVVFFDGEGLLHYDHIQGGIAYTSPYDDIEVAASYTSDPDGANDLTLLLDEKRIEVKLNSVVNNIYVKGVDRTNKTIVMMNATAKTDEDILCYMKTIYASVPSLGSMSAVNDYIERLKPRVYKPILGITIKTADDLPITPMTFIDVDGQKFRVMSLSRSIRVDDNSISTSITGEWMGKQP